MDANMELCQVIWECAEDWVEPFTDDEWVSEAADWLLQRGRGDLDKLTESDIAEALTDLGVI